MNLRKRMTAILLAVLSSFYILGAFAYADNNLVPYNPGTQTETPAATTSETTATTTTSDGTPDYASDLFEHTTISADPSVASTVQTISSVASWILTFVISVLPILLTIQLLIDIVCILLKPAAVLFSHFPFQVNADEEIMVTGIQYVGGGGEGEAKSTSIEKVDLKGESPVLFYVKKRIITILFAVVMCTLLGTGLLFKLIYWASNHIVSWIAGIF